MGYYAGSGARKVATVQPSAALPQTQPACQTEREHRPRRLRQLGGVGVLVDPVHRRLGHLLRQARPRGRHHRREPHRLRRARRHRATPTCSSRPPTPPGRPTTRYGGNSLYGGIARPAAPTRSATTGRSPPRGTPPRTPSSAPSTRWSASSRPTATTSATPPASTPTVAAPSCSSTRRSSPSATTSTGRPAARQRRGRPRRRGPPRLLQRQRGLLEDPLGEQHRRHRPPPTARSSPTRRRRPTPRSTRTPRGPARGATRASARRRTAAGPRTRSPARSSWSTAIAPTPSRSPRPTARCASGATPRSPPSPAGTRATFGRGTLGYEWDEDLDNGFRPPGSIRLSTATYDVPASCSTTAAPTPPGPRPTT